MVALAACASARRVARARRVIAAAAIAACTVIAAGAASASELQGCADAAERERLLVLLNAMRQHGGSCAAGPAPPLSWDERLATSARAQADDLAHRDDDLSHVDSRSRTLGERLLDADYGYSLATENLASGALRFDQVMQIWRASAKHCANLMRPELRDVGLACAVRDGGGGAGQRVWVANFAAPLESRASSRARRAALVAGSTGD